LNLCGQQITFDLENQEQKKHSLDGKQLGVIEIWLSKMVKNKTLFILKQFLKQIVDCHCIDSIFFLLKANFKT
jgi:hypothetical protein